MEPEDSFLHSLVPATCPYLEPVRSSHYPHILKILPSKPRSPKWSLYLRFPHQNPVYTSTVPHTRYRPRPSHFGFYYPHRIEKISWTGHVRNEEVLRGVNEQRNILHEIRKRKGYWIGHILRRNCLLQRVIEGKIKGQI